MDAAADTTAVLHFGVLGALRVTGPSGIADIGSRQQRRVLAALLVHARDVVSTDRLADVLWGDDPPSTALKTLRTYVYRLRRVLDGEDGQCLVTRSPGYLLDVAPAQVDAARFEQLAHDARRAIDTQPYASLSRLQRALELWRGPAYAEFADEDFARAEALRLEELRLAATEDLLDAKLATGRHIDVVGEAETFARRHPLRERPVAQLMLALYRSGRQADALQTYRAFRERLGDQGLDPSERLRALEADILRRDRTVAPSTPHQPTAPAPDGDGRATPATTTDRLPPERTSLVGREQDVATVVEALDDCRLVTLTGVGGVGKTRLALRAARTATHRYPDGAWWCDLTSVTTSDAVAHAVAAALDVHAPGDSVTDSIADAVGARRLLLVVDNCEHFVDAARPLLELVLARCPQVSVLATSRTPLHVIAERVWRLDPLHVATARGEVGDSDAVALFLDRVRAVRQDVALTDATREVITDICRRLDGLPLAIELAAARMRALNAEDLAARLDDRFRLLTDTPHATVDRHRTLQAVVDWSFDLLSTTEQLLFERLAVFVGEFTLTAAEHVCAGAGIADDEIVDLIARLVDASMVVTGPPDDTMRYRLLETLRAYGRERLTERGDVDRVRRLHAQHYVTVAEEADQQIRGADEPAAVATLNRELPELRAAHLWGMEQGDPDLSLRLVAALFRYALWRLRDEVFRWAEAAVGLQDATAHPLFPTVCGMAGWGCGLRGERARAGAFARAGLEAAPDGRRRVAPLEVQGHLALWEGRLDDCIASMDEAAELTDDPYNQFPWTVRALALAYADRNHEAVAMVEHAQLAGDSLRNPTIMALARYAHGEALMDHDPDAAAVLFDAVMDLADRSENRMLLGVAGVSTTSLHARHGEPTKALRSFAYVLDVWSQTNDWTHLWVGLRSLVELLARIGSDEAAAVLHGAVLDAPGAPPVYGADADRLAHLAAELDQRLGTSQMAAARLRGQTMAADDLLDWTRAEINRNLAAPPATRPG